MGLCGRLCYLKRNKLTKFMELIIKIDWIFNWNKKIKKIAYRKAVVYTRAYIHKSKINNNTSQKTFFFPSLVRGCHLSTCKYWGWPILHSRHYSLQSWFGNVVKWSKGLLVCKEESESKSESKLKSFILNLNKIFYFNIFYLIGYRNRNEI